MGGKPPNSRGDCCNTYVHSSHVTLVSFPDLFHHLLFGSPAVFDGALHRDGPLWVVHSQILQPGHKSAGGWGGEVSSVTAARPFKGAEASYDDIVILVPVSCSIFFRLRPSFPINRPTKLLCTSIFSGISSVLHETESHV